LSNEAEKITDKEDKARSEADEERMKAVLAEHKAMCM
jgi:hypothetical protein